MSPHCDRDLEDSKLIFLKDNPVHNDASPYMFGSKRFSDSENIIWTFTDILKFCCDPDFEHNKPISP